ncbi:MAG TPA: PSD1 and planctomycete cytochrome C domain-containing protein [Planctomycetaceae bacterium]|nr:PSD1 and planctomycete cytochrome C domain-containing protein [Planctomycetaceae bacterium]
MHVRWVRVDWALTLLLAAGPGLSGAAADGGPSVPARPPAAGHRPVDFGRDVFPILTRHCLDCHGPDAQEGRLRLDAKQIVFEGGVSGPAIAPGMGADSLLVSRITGQGGLDRMPLDAEPLSPADVATLRDWIDQGAVWPDGVGVQVASPKRHWAYVKPVRPALPDVTSADWPHNPLDAFVLGRLEAAAMSPSAQAARERLLRRVTFDLTGLPPSIEELDDFLGDDSPDAYEKAVDRLLASPRYGERWAVPWLDAARYADSNGYQRDGRREAWAWRDWVIRAFNADLPFDRFTIEQIAGDLLPGATLDQQIATGFHRNTMANVEAGTDPDEEHVLAVIDRVNTTGTVWLGTTIECAQCHSHKYDPFSQREFYQLYAFFNNTAKEIEVSGSAREFTGPAVELPLAAAQRERRERLQAQIDRLKPQFADVTARLDAGQPEWEREIARSDGATTWTVLEPLEAAADEGTALKRLDDNSLLAGGDFPDTDVYRVSVRHELDGITAFRLEILTHASLPGGGPGRVEPGNFILSEFKVEVADAARPADLRPVELASASADYSQPNWPVAAAIDGNRRTGWAIGRQFGQGHHAVFVLKSPAEGGSGSVLRFTLDQQYGSTRMIGRFQLLATTGDPHAVGLPANIREIAALAADQRTGKQTQQIREYHHAQSSELKDLQAQLTALEAARDAIQPDTTLVMQELSEPRMSRMFQRGDFLSPGEAVEPRTPRVLHALPADDGRPDRLALARWLVDDENPLTARVTVNRQWAELFGRGLVETPEDFGTQGERPTHPELLDWLAVEFREGRESSSQLSTLNSQLPWSLKRLHRLLVTSATYRQSARVTPALLRRDPDNALYARGPRGRLPAEFVRDNALAVAGLLSQKLHGAPVFPYQPPGVWNHIGRASNVWPTSEGDDRYRRGLYVYWRRTVPYPSFVNFDAPSRESCTVQRSRSNTPLQALTLLNDPAYFEAAVRFAARLLTETSPGATPAERVERAFRQATSRQPSPAEIEILVARFESEAARSRQTPTTVEKLTGGLPELAAHNSADLAAWIHVANVLLNLDEVISR